MQSRASSHRYIVMEAYVSMLGGKYKIIEDIIRRLVEVLSVVILHLFSVPSTHQPCLLFLLPNFYQEKMCKRLISLSSVLKLATNQNLESNFKNHGFYMQNLTLLLKSLIMLSKSLECS
jgi:hypothetical protein